MNEPQNALAAAGLPPTWQPTPIGFTLGKLGVNTPEGTQTMHLLILDAATGRQAFAFDDESFRKVGEMILAQSSGLSIVSSLPPSPNGQQ